jgi:predicted Zn-dependent protease
MQRAMRSQGQGPPEFLRTHPVTTTRIAEAKERASKMMSGGYACVMESDGATRECSWTLVGTDGQDATSSLPPAHPAFPFALRDALQASIGQPVRRFDWARERMRVLTAASPADALAEYERLQKAGAALNDAQRYGLALALSEVGRAPQAISEFTELARRHPDFYWLELALAEAEHRSGDWRAAERSYQALLERQPRNRAITLSYAQALAERGDPDSGRQAQEVLRPLLDDGAYDAALQQTFARASETAGDLARAGEAYAANAFLSGRAEDALNQLQRLKERSDLDYVQRSRIDARIAAITPIVLELRAQGIRPGGENRFAAPAANAWRATH